MNRLLVKGRTNDEDCKKTAFHCAYSDRNTGINGSGSGTNIRKTTQEKAVVLGSLRIISGVNGEYTWKTP